ncbi:GUN4 domain-containing protein [Okeanomitos corallinicola TIOX110]|uniref:GUN4 domain-containing protein n=1 Tax=Okeanomitos corallinicola TIOX110 TaxID=3133117 RepID=A0ABZ2UWX2_9CYAN
MYKINYTKLDYLLSQSAWKKADIETRKIMLEITGANQREELLMTATDLQKFPCSELKIIDKLWREASNERFGFHVIADIYKELDQDYLLLAKQVGWCNDGNWIKCEQINFTNDAPVGHLPITWLVPSTFSGYWLARFASAGWRVLLKRIIECEC